MAEINITRPHSLGSEDAHKVVAALVDKLILKFGGQARWQGDSLHYTHAGGVDGRIQCATDEIAVNVNLGFMMSALRKLIETEINQSLDKNLG